MPTDLSISLSTGSPCLSTTVAARIAGILGDGGWWSLNDPARLYQERSAPLTTLATNGDRIGTILDKSGNGQDATAPSDAARPTHSVVSGSIFADYDGSDNELNITLAAPASLDDCSVFIVTQLPASDTLGILIRGQSNSRILASYQLNNLVNTINDTAGSPTTYVDGVLQSPDLRDTLFDSINDSTNHIIEVRNADLSGWTTFNPSIWPGTPRVDGYVGDIMIVPNITAASRQMITDYLAGLYGITPF